MASVLFSPLSLRSMHLENRIVVSPLAQFMADESENATDWHLMHLGTLAVAGGAHAGRGYALSGALCALPSVADEARHFQGNSRSRHGFYIAIR